MDLRPEPDQSAIRLAERLVQLLDRGGFTATYKYAVLVALMDVSMERTSATGSPPETITTRQLAEKVVELYWPHCAPYDSKRGVLRQNKGRRDSQAEIVRHIHEFRQRADARGAASLPLSRARAAAPDAYERLARTVEWKLIEMPLPRLQYVSGEEEDRFLYEYAFDKHISKRGADHYREGSIFDNQLRLQPGVGAALLALNGLLRPLIHRQWALMVAEANGLKQSALEEFLFGSERISLAPVRPGLCELQDGRCFYCGDAIHGVAHIDHFVPWSRHADNSIDNLVAADERCNGMKRNYLAAAEHVVRWRERSRLYGADLARIAGDARWESEATRTFSVARAIYFALPQDARLWRAGEEFVRIDQPRITAALAA
jgi:HNH endonuclease